MRRSRAKDEIVLLQDMRVQRNRAYLIIALLGRVVTQLGSLKDVNTGVIENLFASDLRFLEEMYNRINEDEVMISVKYPECGANFEKEFGRLGSHTPWKNIYKEVAFIAYHFTGREITS